MIVDSYYDHIAYTCEAEEVMDVYAMEAIQQLQSVNMLHFLCTKRNLKDCLLFDAEQTKLVQDIIGNISINDFRSALKYLCDDIYAIIQVEHLNLMSIDVKYERLRYDTRKKRFSLIILPIKEFRDSNSKETWSQTFGRLIQTLIKHAFAENNALCLELITKIQIDGTSYPEILFAIREQLERCNSSTQGALFVPERYISLRYEGDKGTVQFDIDKESYVVGTSLEHADGIVNITKNISRKHCLIQYQNGAYIVTDLESTNGTKINGYLLTPGSFYCLNNGDVLSLADVNFDVVISKRAC